ncbi:hypothetical protein H5410_051170 [Solanum commersonii]|uniref:Uncharacterized protein n=1 Tax=Solanum commersonii TaxID=4109 RepID=A0A9J5WYU2_SOLCO|nr:hypothetical protein H5410_051170 [Solanum commersonii]
MPLYPLKGSYLVEEEVKGSRPCRVGTEGEASSESALRKKWNSDENVVLLHLLKENGLTYPTNKLDPLELDRLEYLLTLLVSEEVSRAHLLPTIQQSEFHRREVSEIPTLRKEKKLDHEKASRVSPHMCGTQPYANVDSHGFHGKEASIPPFLLVLVAMGI